MTQFTAKVGPKGVVVVPKAVREKDGIEAGDLVTFNTSEVKHN